MLTINDPWLDAEQRFKAGRITIAQAVAMICSDRTFMAECDLTGRKPRQCAEAIVRERWAPVLVKRIQDARKAS